ncbi:MAG: LamG domain-containing protein, partial [bacterium]|nr:LamG domain-containing protein [bacterium]
MQERAGLVIALLICVLTLMLGSRAVADVTTDSMISWWRFDETSGSSAYDDSTYGHGNTGTINYATHTTSGMTNSALAFTTGTNVNYVNVGKQTSLNGLTTSATVEVWIYPTATGISGIFDRSTGGSGNSGPFHMWFLSTGQVVFRIANGTANISKASRVLSLNTWHHIVGTFDSQYVRLYVDGIEDGPATKRGTFNPVDRSTYNWLIGNLSVTNTTTAFCGKIDEVRLYNRALSAAEVQQNYMATVNLVYRWRFDEASGTAAYDDPTCGYGNTGTITNAQYTTTTGSMVNTALSFTTSTYNCVNVGHSASLSGLTAATTVSAWIYPTAASLGGIFDKSSGGSGNIGPYQMWFLNTRQVVFRIANGSTNRSKVSRALTLNAWHHVVGTFDGQYVRLYVDGFEDGSPTTNNITPADSYPLRDWLIGNLSTSNSNTAFSGTIDELRVYGRALAAAEVRRDYNLGAFREHAEYIGIAGVFNPLVVGPGPSGSERIYAVHCFDESPAVLAINPTTGDCDQFALPQPPAGVSAWTNVILSLGADGQV